MKRWLNILVITLILAILLYFFYNNIYKQYIQFYYNYTYEFSNKEPINKHIPKVVIQTYYNKSKIPNKVYDNIKKYAPDYNHIIYDDQDCIDFMNQFDKKFSHIKKSNFSLSDKFKSYKKGAHKADLFRYCYLYQYGGIYLDIKTELIKPLNQLFINDNTLYTVIAADKKSIYQGIIAVYPLHPMLGELINQAVSSKNFYLLLNYSLFLEFFYNCIMDEIKNHKIFLGNHNTYSGYSIHLLHEEDHPISDCVVADRYKRCTFIQDENNNIVIKTRYSDFPW